MAEYSAADVAAVATLDPAADRAFPRIAPWTADTAPEVWPPRWGDEVTERDAVGMHLFGMSVMTEHGAPPVLPDPHEIPVCPACREVIGSCEVCGTTMHARTMVPRGAAVNINDYRPASAKGWGMGWPACGGAAGNLVIVTADRSGVRFSVHRRIAVLWDHLIDRMEARGYLCKAGQCGAYNCRAIGGTKVPSNHSWALAGDLNWNDNPFTVATSPANMPLWVPREVFNPYGFGWGGDYRQAKKDRMHLEFLGSPAQADEQTARVLAASPAIAPTPAGGVRVLELRTPHMTGADVTSVQKVLRAWYGLPVGFVDGDYGPTTVTYVKRAQGGTPPAPALAADGAVGPATRAKLGL